MPSKGDKIRFQKEDHEVRSVYRLHGERYYVIGNYGRNGRKRLRTLLWIGGRYRERILHLLENTRENYQRLQLLLDADGSSLPVPRLRVFEKRGKAIEAVTEHVPGESLRRYLKACREGKRQPVSPYLALKLNSKLVYQVANLVGKKNWLHADICPDNLIISSNTTRLTLIDFGSLLRYADSRQGPRGDGSQAIYQAPEVLAGEPPTWQSELFSCGMVFYETLTRTIAYDGRGGQAGETGPPLLPPSRTEAIRGSTFPRELWAELDAYAAKSLACRRSERYPTMSAAIAAQKRLVQAADSYTTTTADESWLDRWLKKIGL